MCVKWFNCVSANYWKSTFFSCPGAIFFACICGLCNLERSLNQQNFLLWHLCELFSSSFLISGLFLSFSFAILFFFLHRLIEYIRQLINLYNKIETINLLGFFSHTLNYSLNRYEYASIISCFYQFPLIEKSVERIPFKPLFLSSSSLSKFLIFMLIDHFNYVIFLCFFFSNYKASPSIFIVNAYYNFQVLLFFTQSRLLVFIFAAINARTN